ncbi:MAG: hypothetical protein JHD33_01620 [Chthoniobacterales bacterium]|jgi:uncharacterized lipoprotein|nr:hypothetical protein [Chthoniobacterales bacterium]
MRLILALLLSASAASLLSGCANDSYDDPTYRLQRNLYNRNQNFDNLENRQGMRRRAQDSRYQAWFNSVMQ